MLNAEFSSELFDGRFYVFTLPLHPLSDQSNIVQVRVGDKDLAQINPS